MIQVSGLLFAFDSRGSDVRTSNVRREEKRGEELPLLFLYRSLRDPSREIAIDRSLALSPAAARINQPNPNPSLSKSLSLCLVLDGLAKRTRLSHVYRVSHGVQRRGRPTRSLSVGSTSIQLAASGDEPAARVGRGLPREGPTYVESCSLDDARTPSTQSLARLIDSLRRTTR